MTELSEEEKRHPELAYKTGEYDLRRTTLRGQGYWGQACSDWIRTPLGTPSERYLVPTDEHSEEMAKLIIELEAILEWKNSSTMKLIHYAFDQRDWDAVRAYRKHIRGPKSWGAAVDAAVRGARHLGLDTDTLTDEHVAAVNAMLDTVMLLAPYPTNEQRGELAAVVLANPDDQRTILTILKQRPEATFDPTLLRDLIPEFEAVPSTFHEGVL